MDKPLSYSAYKKYHDCPKLYKFYYIDKDRPGRDTSALAIGSIVDESVEWLLKGTIEAAYESIRGGIVTAKQKPLMFYPDDLDWDLIDKKAAVKFAKDQGWKGDDLKSALGDFLKDQENLSPAQSLVLDSVVWQSLEVKIFAMVESFEKWILPQIKQVHEIQHHLDDGVTHGYLDFTATLKDDRKVLFDLKTSKMPYAQDAVLKSPQLSLYAAMHDYEYAGYIVLNKSLNKNKVKTCAPCGTEIKGGNTKNCPSCKTPLKVSMNPTSYSQMLVNKVPDWNKALTKEAMRETIEAIDKGVFPSNLNTCFWMYGRDCVYAKKCWRLND